MSESKRQGLAKCMSAGEGLHGCWKSEKGECTIGKDPVTARLSYTDASQQMKKVEYLNAVHSIQWHLDSCHPCKEPVGDGSRVHGWLDIVEEGLWHGTLVLLKVGGLEVWVCLKLMALSGW